MRIGRDALVLTVTQETAAAFVDEVKAQAEGSRLQQQQEEQQEVSWQGLAYHHSDECL